VTRPTTMLWSDGDVAIGRAGVQACGRHVESDYRLVEFSGVSHWLPDQVPDQVAEAILARVTA
jgi:pimeloyl-ACP methyl ester carboxylesterase